MEQETQIETYKSIVVPESALLRRERGSKYGSVPGLDDDELADPQELERNITLKEWGPVLALPEPKWSDRMRPVIDENGGVDWGAFGTVDFDRHRPKLDKIQYKADRLREERWNVLIMLSIVAQRVPGNAKWLVLQHVHAGAIELDQINHEDVLVMARLYLRTEQMRKEIAELEEKRRERERRNVARMLARWD